MFLHAFKLEHIYFLNAIQRAITVGFWKKEHTAVEPIYDACMQEGTDLRLTATQVSTAHVSPFSLYCAYHADPAKRDPPDPFLQALSEQGVEHEADVLESDYPEMEDVSYDTPEEGFMHLLQFMAKGTEVLSNFPLFYLPDGMYGYADVLEKCNGESAWGKHHYVIREIKVAKNVKAHHMIQAAFYTLMLGHIQQYRPEYFLITNGEGNTSRHQYSDYEGVLLESIKRAIQIHKGVMPPVVYGTAAPPWSSYCNEIAIQNNDISLIPGIGASKRDAMSKAGFRTVQDVASSTTTPLEEIKGIGKKTASAYWAAARAITGKECIKKTGIKKLPERQTEIFLDLEGLNAVFDDTLSDYLIGILVRKDGKEKYHSFIAEGKREDLMLRSFLDFMEKQKDYAIYHWHNYERTHLNSMMERHNMHAQHLLGNDVMFDLHKIATDAFAFPTYSNSIKDIAKWLGFEWRHNNVGAMTSIELYLKYAEDSKLHKDKMQLVQDYNEDDCIATRVIKDWLSNSNSSVS